jgi:hypothetical protein
MTEEFETGRWYWDRRNRKALYPRRVEDGTVEFVTVWHAEEVADALDGGALVPVEEVGVDHSETLFDIFESFRMPEDVEDPPEEATTDGGSDAPEGDA